MLRIIDFRQYVFIQRILLGAIFICIIMPVLWIMIFDYSQKKIVRNFMKTLGTQPANLAFEKVTVKMIQRNNKIMVLNAPSSQIYDLDISRIDLQNPIVTVFEQNKPPKILSATTGIYRKQNNNLTLLDNLKMSETGTFDINSDKMLVDLNNFTFTLPNGINGTYNTHSLKAKNVKIHEKTKKATFKGGVKLVIDPKPHKNI